MTRYRYFCHFAELGMAVVSKTLNRESNIVKLLKLIWYSPIYLLSKSRRQSQFKSFITSGDTDLIMKMAKFSGNSFSRFMFYWINPSIKFHKKIYIPKSYERFTTAGLNDTLKEFMDEDSEAKAIENKHHKKLRASVSFICKPKEKLEVLTQAFYKKNGVGRLCLRIVCPFSLDLNPNPTTNSIPPRL